MTDRITIPHPDRPTWPRWLAVGVLVVIVLFVVQLLPNRGGDTAGNLPAAIGKKLEGLKAQPLDAGPEPSASAQPLVSADLAGRVALVNIWGPWCGYCRMEFPSLVDIDNRWRENKDFRFVSISYPLELGPGSADFVQETINFAKEQKARFPVYVDPDGTTFNAIRQLLPPDERNQVGFPVTLVIDRDGITRGAWMGFQSGNEREMDRLLRSLLPAK